MQKQSVTSDVRSIVPTAVRASALAFSTLLAVAAGSATAATTYSTTAVVLEKLPSTSTIYLKAIGPTGSLVGQSFANLTDNSPVLWNASGQITDLTPGLTGSISSFYAADINTAGQVLLQADTPFLWTNGVLTPLNLGLEGRVNAFNDAGQIIGNSTLNQAFISTNGLATIITPPSSLSPTTSLSPNDINNKGQVILSAFPLTGRRPALFWENGVTLDLGALPGDVNSMAAAINEAGQIVGSSSIGSSFEQSRAVIWENGVIRDLGGATYGPIVSAWDINNLGQIVGNARSVAAGSSTSLLWNNDGITNLNPVLGQTASRCSPYGINDAGQIAILCSIPNTIDIAYYRLTPVATGADVGVVITPSTTSASVGGTLTYNVSVTNAGASTVSGVSLTDVLPTGVNFVSATPSQGSCSGTTTVACALGSLGSGVSANVQINAIATVVGTLTNSASVTANEADVNALNDNASVVVSVTAPVSNADLGVAMTDSPDPVRRRANLTYAINVTNAGPSAASAVTVTDSLPASMRFVSASVSQGSCSGTSTVTCNLGGLANGASASVTIVVRPQSLGTYANTVAVRSSTPDNISTNNSATVTTRVR